MDEGLRRARQDRPEKVYCRSLGRLWGLGGCSGPSSTFFHFSIPEHPLVEVTGHEQAVKESVYTLPGR